MDKLSKKAYTQLKEKWAEIFLRVSCMQVLMDPTEKHLDLSMRIFYKKHYMKPTRNRYVNPTDIFILFCGHNDPNDHYCM